MKFFLSKTFALLLVFILVQIPVHMVENINQERQSFKQDATQSVSRSYAGNQYVSGPILMLPYTYNYWEPVLNKDGNQVGREQHSKSGIISLLPQTLQMDNNITVETRKVGIFPVPVFKAAIRISARFHWDEQQAPVTLKSADDTIEWGQAYLSLPIADQHGIKQITTMQWDGKDLAYQPGTHNTLYGGQGISANVTASHSGGTSTADIQLTLIGTELLRNLPTAEQTTVNMQSNWPNPQFTGTQLPDSRAITRDGFNASWQSTALATNITARWKACSNGSTEQCKSLEGESLGVSLIDPTNFYATMSRALKYGFMFLAITFLSFLLFEVLCDLRIHPVQYTLVGIASGIFFLLLLSLAEHIGFALAYAVAALACLILLSLYANALLKQWQRTLGFSAILASLYGVLYVILQQEDAALLTGSALLFALLAIAMMATRHIDWFAWQNRLARNTDAT